MADRYPIPAHEHRVSEEIQRSKFITIAAPAATPDEARAFLASVREEFPDATHHCWAYLCGLPGSSGQVGMSDDGEPHGTAGRPMLEVLTHSGLGDIAAVVVRYYGGTKLGKGGLMRAYSGGVQKVIDTLPTLEKVKRVEIRTEVGYGDVNGLQRLAAEHEVEIVDENYGEQVVYTLAVPEEGVSFFIAALENLTNGKVRVEKI